MPQYWHQLITLYGNIPWKVTLLVTD